MLNKLTTYTYTPIQGVLTAPGPFSSLTARGGWKIRLFPVGAELSADGSGSTSAATYALSNPSSHTFENTDYAMVCKRQSYANGQIWVPNFNQIATISGGVGTSTLTLSTGLTWSTGDYLLNLGLDGNSPSIGGTPAFDQRVQLYSAESSSSSFQVDELVTTPGGFYRGFVNATTYGNLFTLLAFDESDVLRFVIPEQVYPAVSL